MKFTLLISLLILLSAVAVSLAGRPESGGSFYEESAAKRFAGGNGDGGMGGFFGPGGGFNIPGFGPGMGGGYGVGYGGPGGGYAGGGTVRSSVVCKQRGPCYKKRVTCPAKCFSSFSHSGKGYGYGGGGGGCTIDCQKKCIGYC